MALTELLNKKVEIPLRVQIPMSDIGDFIKEQKESLMSAINNHVKKYNTAKEAREARKSCPPVKPPDGPKQPITPANRASADTNKGYYGTPINIKGSPASDIPTFERFEIPLATKEDFIPIHQPIACSGTINVGFGFSRGKQIGYGIFNSIQQMPPANPVMLEQVNRLLETTEEITPRKLPDSRDIPDSITINSSSKEFKEILDILYKNKRI
jgi:hypothetical protein